MARYSVRDEKGRFVKKTTSGPARGADGRFISKATTVVTVVPATPEAKETIKKFKGVQRVIGNIIDKMEKLLGCIEKLNEEDNKED